MATAIISASIASSSTSTHRCGTPRAMKTMRLRRSSDGQRSSQAGAMKDMLHAVDHGRPLRALGDVDDALEPQRDVAAMLGERFEKERQRDGPDRPISHDRKGRDVGVVGMAVIVASSASHAAIFAAGSARSTPNKITWVDPAMVRAQNRRPGVE